MVAHRTKMKAGQRLIDMIGWMLRIPSGGLFLHTSFKDDLNLDTIDMILLVAQLENHMGVYLSPEEVASIQTVGDAVGCFGRDSF